MKAAITCGPGDPQVIEIHEIKIPSPKRGWILIKIKAFGLNRSEIFTRQGYSPNVKFPLIQGIECVGIVADDPSNEFAKGQQVAAIMGGMGRNFDGGYPEYVIVPKKIVFPFNSELPWNVLGALPEMFQTVSGSLYQALEIQSGESLLIRGAASSIGMLACQMAKAKGLKVITTTRNPDKQKALLNNGADLVIIDNGNVSTDLKEYYPKGVNKVLELIGTRTLKDSLKCIGYKGMVCMTGILGNEWTLSEYTPMGDIPSLGRLTVYMGESENLKKEFLQEFIDGIEKGDVKINVAKIFPLDKIVEAHKYMESNQAKGKIVVET